MSDLWCSHISKLPLGMYLNMRALNSSPLESIVEHEVMTLTRFRCRMFLRDSHSAMKLIDDPCKFKLKTLIATGFLVSSNVPLYTVPNEPEPIMLAQDNLSVALIISSYDTFTLLLERRFVVFEPFFRRTMLKHDSDIVAMTATGMAICFVKDLCFVLCSSVQMGSPSMGALVHNLLFPSIDTLLAFSKTPVVGIAPLKSLNDRLRYSKEARGVNISGISPDRLFRERSTSLMPFKFVRESGILPSRKFPSICRVSSTIHWPSVDGIWLDN